MRFYGIEVELRSKRSYTSGMSKKTRTLTVVRSLSQKPKALLPLSGRWLEKAGFTIGTKVNVIVREECLVIITKHTDN